MRYETRNRGESRRRPWITAVDGRDDPGSKAWTAADSLALAKLHNGTLVGLPSEPNTNPPSPLPADQVRLGMTLWLDQGPCVVTALSMNESGKTVHVTVRLPNKIKVTTKRQARTILKVSQ